MGEYMFVFVIWDQALQSVSIIVTSHMLMDGVGDGVGGGGGGAHMMSLNIW